MADLRSVQLVVPADASAVRVARMVSTGVATDAGFDVDDVEDLRIAVTELFALLIEDAEEPAEQVVLAYDSSPGQVKVTGSRAMSNDGDAPAIEDLALEILNVVVDEHDFNVDEGG